MYKIKQLDMIVSIKKGSKINKIAVIFKVAELAVQLMEPPNLGPTAPVWDCSFLPNQPRPVIFSGDDTRSLFPVAINEDQGTAAE